METLFLRESQDSGSRVYQGCGWRRTVTTVGRRASQSMKQQGSCAGNSRTKHLGVLAICCGQLVSGTTSCLGRPCSFESSMFLHVPPINL